MTIDKVKELYAQACMFSEEKIKKLYSFICECLESIEDSEVVNCINAGADEFTIEDDSLIFLHYRDGDIIKKFPAQCKLENKFYKISPHIIILSCSIKFSTNTLIIFFDKVLNSDVQSSAKTLFNENITVYPDSISIPLDAITD